MASFVGWFVDELSTMDTAGGMNGGWNDVEAGEVSGSERQISAESEIIKPSPPPLSQHLPNLHPPRENPWNGTKENLTSWKFLSRRQSFRSRRWSTGLSANSNVSRLTYNQSIAFFNESAEEWIGKEVLGIRGARWSEFLCFCLRSSR